MQSKNERPPRTWGGRSFRCHERLWVGQRVIGADVVRSAGGRNIFVVVPSCDGGSGAGVGEFEANGVVHITLSLADADGQEVVEAGGFKRRRWELEGDPLGVAGEAAANGAV